MKNQGYHRLRVVIEGKKMVKMVYLASQSFPKSELYGLTSQLRRATLSILLNIVEGDRRKSNKEFLRFLEIADGSSAEVEVCLEVALDLLFLSEKQYQELESQRQLVTSMLIALMKKVKEKS